MIKPNFKHSILNLSATLADFVGDKNSIKKLNVIEDKLKNAPKNVVFIIFDGLGKYNVDLLTTNNDFYKSHMVDVLSSTMPATTTNATTAMSTCSYPDEHLWLAWSLWLKNQQRVVEIYLSRDFHTGEKTEKYDRPIENFIDRAKTDRRITTIAPGFAHYSDKIEAKVANNVDELFSQLNQTLDNKEKQFIYCYCDQPDATMHDEGVDSPKVKEIFENIQTQLQNLINIHKDLLIITTADHGHINASKYLDICDDKEIMSLLSRPISMEPRFASFKVKEGKEKEFKKVFKKKYGKYFYLLSQDYILKNHIFGLGANTAEIKEFIGDFIAVGNNSYVALNINNRAEDKLKGLHAGGSKAEMQVPLCVFESKL